MAHPLMQFFSFGHLPDHLKAASEPFALAAAAVNACGTTLRGSSDIGEDLVRTTGLERDLARLSAFVADLPVNLESNEAMRKIASIGQDLYSVEVGQRFAHITDVMRMLLEAKDCAVRAALYKEPAP